jgi:hypothetical protein
MPDLMQVLMSLADMIPAFMKVLQGVATLMGFFLVGCGMYELWATSSNNQQRLLGGRKEFTWGGGFVSLIIGGMMTAFSNLDIIAPLSSVYSGRFVTSQLVAYQVARGASLTEQAKAVISVIFMILQLVGFWAFLKSFWIVNDRANNGPQHNVSLGKAFGFMSGGFVAWNAKWCIDVLRNTTGINIIGMFLN